MTNESMYCGRGKLLPAIGIIFLLVITVFPHTGAQTRKRLFPDDKEWGAVKEGLRLAVRVDAPQAAAGDQIVCTVLLKNASKRPLLLVETYPERDFEIAVFDSKGSLVSLTAHGQKLLQAEVYRQVSVRIKPGQVVERKIMLNQVFDLSTPGEYSISVRRNIPQPNSDAGIELVSNKTNFKVAG